VSIAALGACVDNDALQRLRSLGLLRVDEGLLRLTRRGRFLGGGVTAELMAGDRALGLREALAPPEATLRS
jgi:hypothetical protein